jgi:hypothetical protein
MRLYGLRGCLVEEVGRAIDRYLMLHDALHGDVAQLEHSHFCSIIYNSITFGERCQGA